VIERVTLKRSEYAKGAAAAWPIEHSTWQRFVKRKGDELWRKVVGAPISWYIAFERLDSKGNMINRALNLAVNIKLL
jgi:hypothetical protein